MAAIREQSAENATNDSETLATLRLAYEDRVRESTRLRDARRAFTAQLGFLPVSASVVVGLFAGFGETIDEPWLAFALIPFVVAVAIGAFFSRRDPYRTIRGEIEKKEQIDWLRLSPERWLMARIRHEDLIYRELARSMMSERRGVHVVQALVIIQILYVIIIAVV